MGNFFKQLFSDNNNINEKTLIGFFAFLIMVIFTVINTYLGITGKEELVPQETIFDAYLWLTLGAFGISSVDKFINKTKSSSYEPPYVDYDAPQDREPLER